MADQDKWKLSREEIEERIRKSDQEWKRKGPTRGGRSSGQGVKLLYTRDFLYAHATKEHPKNAKHIRDFLATKAIDATPKTIYNDILRLQIDFGVPIEWTDTYRNMLSIRTVTVSFLMWQSASSNWNRSRQRWEV